MRRRGTRDGASEPAHSSSEVSQRDLEANELRALKADLVHRLNVLQGDPMCRRSLADRNEWRRTEPLREWNRTIAEPWDDLAMLFACLAAGIFAITHHFALQSPLDEQSLAVELMLPCARMQWYASVSRFAMHSTLLSLLGTVAMACAIALYQGLMGSFASFRNAVRRGAFWLRARWPLLRQTGWVAAAALMLTVSCWTLVPVSLGFAGGAFGWWQWYDGSFTFEHCFAIDGGGWLAWCASRSLPRTLQVALVWLAVKLQMRVVNGRLCGARGVWLCRCGRGSLLQARALVDRLAAERREQDASLREPNQRWGCHWYIVEPDLDGSDPGAADASSRDGAADLDDGVSAPGLGLGLRSSSGAQTRKNKQSARPDRGPPVTPTRIRFAERLLEAGFLGQLAGCALLPLCAPKCLRLARKELHEREERFAAWERARSRWLGPGVPTAGFTRTPEQQAADVLAEEAIPGIAPDKVLDFCFERYRSKEPARPGRRAAVLARLLASVQAAEQRQQRIESKQGSAGGAVAASAATSRVHAVSLGRNATLSVFAAAGPACFHALALTCRGWWLLASSERALWVRWWNLLTRGRVPPPSALMERDFREALIGLQRAKEDLGRKPVALTASDADEFCYFLNPLPWPKRTVVNGRRCVAHNKLLRMGLFHSRVRFLRLESAVLVLSRLEAGTLSLGELERARRSRWQFRRRNGPGADDELGAGQDATLFKQRPADAAIAPAPAAVFNNNNGGDCEEEYPRAATYQPQWVEPDGTELPPDDRTYSFVHAGNFRGQERKRTAPSAAAVAERKGEGKRSAERGDSKAAAVAVADDALPSVDRPIDARTLALNRSVQGLRLRAHLESRHYGRGPWFNDDCEDESGQMRAELLERRAALCSYAALRSRPHDGLQFITRGGGRRVLRPDRGTAALLADFHYEQLGEAARCVHAIAEVHRQLQLLGLCEQLGMSSDTPTFTSMYLLSNRRRFQAEAYVDETRLRSGLFAHPPPHVLTEMERSLPWSPGFPRQDSTANKVRLRDTLEQQAAALLRMMPALHPTLVREPPNAALFRQAAELRALRSRGDGGGSSGNDGAVGSSLDGSGLGGASSDAAEDSAGDIQSADSSDAQQQQPGDSKRSASSAAGDPSAAAAESKAADAAGDETVAMQAVRAALDRVHMISRYDFDPVMMGPGDAEPRQRGVRALALAVDDDDRPATLHARHRGTQQSAGAGASASDDGSSASSSNSSASTSTSPWDEDGAAQRALLVLVGAMRGGVSPLHGSLAEAVRFLQRPPADAPPPSFR